MAQIPEGESCELCVYRIEEEHEGQIISTCRWNCPQMVQLDHTGQFPVVQLDFWCRNFKKEK